MLKHNLPPTAPLARHGCGRLAAECREPGQDRLLQLAAGPAGRHLIIDLRGGRLGVLFRRLPALEPLAGLGVLGVLLCFAQLLRFGDARHPLPGRARLSCWPRPGRPDLRGGRTTCRLPPRARPRRPFGSRGPWPGAEHSRLRETTPGPNSVAPAVRPGLVRRTPLPRPPSSALPWSGTETEVAALNIPNDGNCTAEASATVGPAGAKLPTTGTTPMTKGVSEVSEMKPDWPFIMVTPGDWLAKLAAGALAGRGEKIERAGRADGREAEGAGSRRGLQSPAEIEIHAVGAEAPTGADVFGEAVAQ